MHKVIFRISVLRNVKECESFRKKTIYPYIDISMSIQPIDFSVMAGLATEYTP